MQTNDIWLTADLHFGHDNICTGSSEWGWRPFEDARAMGEKIVEDWNAVVAPSDRVICVGDFQFVYDKDNVQDAEWISRLNGSIGLVKGNHDRTSKWPEEMTRQFNFIKERYELKVKGRGYKGHKLVVVCDHFPLLTWNRRRYGAMHAYGHVHDTRPHPKAPNPISGSMDVGIDCAHAQFGEWRPFHLDEFTRRVRLDFFKDEYE